MSLLREGNPVVWFEIPATDLERARAFYGAIFGIELQTMDLGDLRFGFFPMKEGLASAAGALAQLPSTYTPSHQGTLVYFGVRDIEQVLTRVEASGGRVLQHRKPIGEFGSVGFFEDSEGNRVGLHERN